MFGFLKNKLKGALGKLTKEVEKDSVTEKKEVLVERKPEDKKVEKKPAVTKPAAKPAASSAPKPVKKSTDKPVDDIKIQKRVDVPKVSEPKKKSFFQKIFGKKDQEEVIEEKEELRERAEKIIIEPELSKDKPKPVPVKKTQATSKPKVSAAKPITSKPALASQEPKIKSVEIAPEIVVEQEEVQAVSVQQDVEELSDDIQEDEQELQEDLEEVESTSVAEQIVTTQSEPEHAVSTPSKPHYQVVEEERENKPIEHKEEEHKGFFTKITETFTKIQISEEKFEELFWELEVVLLENNVAVEVIDKIKRDLKKELMTGKVSRRGVEELILSTLKQSITELFDVEKIDLIDRIKSKRKNGSPYIVAIIGVNGSGKTTSIAKLTHKLQKEGLSVVLAASDTFRAAAIQQLEEHANKLNVKMVKHDYNSDPAAVAFDAIKYAEAKNVDVVLIDTAGRLHSNTNLMRELEKVIRVCKPDLKIFVGESITGNDCVEQAKEFDKAVGIDAIILAKADVDDKGGAAISVSYILQRPILYIGTGQTYDDLKEFDSKLIIESLEL